MGHGQICSVGDVCRDPALAQRAAAAAAHGGANSPGDSRRRPTPVPILRPVPRRPPISPRRFGGLCVAVVAAVALGTVLPGVWNERATHHDFGQFYMGGVVARAGAWGSLYPVPNPDSTGNPGWTYGSTMKPAYADLAQGRGVGSTFRYIQPPPDALLYLPLAWLSYQNAYRAWHVLMAALVVVTAAQAGRVYAAVAGGDGGRGTPAGRRPDRRPPAGQPSADELVGRQSTADRDAGGRDAGGRDGAGRDGPVGGRAGRGRRTCRGA